MNAFINAKNTLILFLISFLSFSHCAHSPKPRVILSPTILSSGSFFVRAEINSFLVHHNQWAASFEHCELLFQYRFSDSISGAGENSILLEVNSEGQIRCNEEIRFTVQNQESGIYVDTLDDTSRRALIEQLTLDVTNAVLLQLYEDSFFEK